MIIRVYCHSSIILIWALGTRSQNNKKWLWMATKHPLSTMSLHHLEHLLSSVQKSHYPLTIPESMWCFKKPLYLVPHDKGVANPGCCTWIARTQRQHSWQIAHANKHLAVAIEIQEAGSQCHVGCPQHRQWDIGVQSGGCISKHFLIPVCLPETGSGIFAGIQWPYSLALAAQRH